MYFYTRNRDATSQMGRKGSAVRISDAKRELKLANGLKQQEVVSNLTYLIDNNWVKPIHVTKSVQLKGGTVPQVTTFFQITAKGIDKIEGGSQFEPKERYAGINITATGENIITLGDGNVVNSQYSELREALNDLKTSIAVSSRIVEAEKLNLAADIESIKDQLSKPQLSKPQPNFGVIAQLWQGLEKVSVIAGVAQAWEAAQPIMKALLPL